MQNVFIQMKTDYSPLIVSGQNCLSSSSTGSTTLQDGQPRRLHVDIVPRPTDGTHIRVSKHVANKFKEIGTYNETADILKSLIDFYLEGRGKKELVIGRKRLMIPADRRCHDCGVMNEEGKTRSAVVVIWRGAQRVESNIFPDVNQEGEIELLAELPKGAKLEED